LGQLAQSKFQRCRNYPDNFVIEGLEVRQKHWHKPRSTRHMHIQAQAACFIASHDVRSPAAVQTKSPKKH